MNNLPEFKSCTKPFLFALLLILITFNACKKDDLKEEELYFPSTVDNTWETIHFKDLGIERAKLDTLIQFVRTKKSHSLIVLHKGKILIEKYWQTYTEDQRDFVGSVEKGFVAFLIGKAQEEGLLNINNKMSDHLGDGWTSMSAAQENAITIKHCLKMTTGFTFSGLCADPECITYDVAPDTKWEYSQAALYKLMDVLAAATGKPYLEYFQEKLINPLNMDVALEDLLMYCRPRDLAKFGLLMLANGHWDEQPMLSDSTYFDAMLQTSQPHNPSYGYLWWLNGKGSYIQPGTNTTLWQKDVVETAPDDMYFAYGTGDIKLYVCPSMDLVVARTGKIAYDFNNLSNSFDEDVWLRIMAMFEE